VFFRIFLVFAAAATVLVLAKERHWFEQTGVLGSCTRAYAPPGDTGQWWSCEEGWLSGYPRLEKEGCRIERRPAAREVWRCPLPLTTAPSGF
jgi:hypothetical protein